jgi:hypothetical protein
VKKFQEKFTDTNNNAKMFVQVLRSEKLKANVQILKDESEGNYLELTKVASQALVTSSRWTMSLAGVATSGKLGTNQQMVQEHQMVQGTVIRPARRTILNRIINPFISIAAEHGNKGFSDLHVAFSDLSLISFVARIDPERNLTMNEKRAMLGMDAVDDETREQIMEENSNNQNSNNGTGNTDPGN